MENIENMEDVENCKRSYINSVVDKALINDIMASVITGKSVDILRKEHNLCDPTTMALIKNKEEGDKCPKWVMRLIINYKSYAEERRKWFDYFSICTPILM